MTVVLTWAMFKWAGLPLLILSLLGLFFGDLPDNEGTSAGNAIRWVAWPLMLIWLAVIFIRGLWL